MFLGIEIGGTKLQIGVGRGDGTLVYLWRGQVLPRAGAAGIRRQIRQATPKILAAAKLTRSDIRGVGIGFGGPVDDATGSILKSHQIAGWEGFPLVAWLQKSLRWPVALGNDADVAGLAEALFGAGRGASAIFYITVGSGIGGGFINAGRIYRGCGKGAAEIGHLRMNAVDPETGATYEADLEDLASGWALAAYARDYVPEDSQLRALCTGAVDKINAVQIAQAAAAGDKFAQDVLDRSLRHLAAAIGHVIALLCPKRIIIGGGVSLIGEQLFFTPLRRLVKRGAFAPFARLTKIVPAALGEAVVVHGALALARQRFE